MRDIATPRNMIKLVVAAQASQGHQENCLSTNALVAARRIDTVNWIWSSLSPSKRVEQISDRKQRKTKNSTPQIEVMTKAIFESPLHRRKQVKRFEDVSQDDHYETSCAEQL